MAKDELYQKEWLALYDALFPKAHYDHTFRIMLHLISQHNPEAKDLLELACGTGKYTLRMVRHGFNVKATDISSDAVSEARRRAPKAKFESVSMTQIREPPASYDLVICMFEALRYMSSYKDCETTLKKACAALRPGGLFMTDFSIYPKGKGSITIPSRIKLGSFKYAERECTYTGSGNFTKRKEHVKIFRKLPFCRPKLLKEADIKRSPMLNIQRADMERMMRKAGFTVLDVVANFHLHTDKVFLFVGKKKVKK